MTAGFEVGDHVTWNSGAGHVGVEVIEVRVTDTRCKFTDPGDDVCLRDEDCPWN
ncbi:MAG: hypothetical protein ABI330_09805 [Caldimonas sp.]|nr:DUF2945 domain-containing protein [Pseudomonadota bacterium]